MSYVGTIQLQHKHSFTHCYVFGALSHFCHNRTFCVIFYRWPVWYGDKNHLPPSLTDMMHCCNSDNIIFRLCAVTAYSITYVSQKDQWRSKKWLVSIYSSIHRMYKAKKAFQNREFSLLPCGCTPTPKQTEHT